MVSAHLETQPVCVCVCVSFQQPRAQSWDLSPAVHYWTHTPDCASALRQWWQTLISYLPLSALCDLVTEHNRHFLIQVLNSLFWIVANISQYKLYLNVLFISIHLLMKSSGCEQNRSSAQHQHSQHIRRGYCHFQVTGVLLIEALTSEKWVINDNV